MKNLKDQVTTLFSIIPTPLLSQPYDININEPLMQHMKSLPHDVCPLTFQDQNSIFLSSFCWSQC